MAPSTCDHGVGAVVSALIRFIHPSEHIRQKFPNPVTGQRLSDCETVRQELKKVSRRDQLVIVVHHADFKTDSGDFIDLYAVKRYWKVQKAGDVDLRFDAAPTNEGGGQEEEMMALPAAVDDYINGDRVNTIEALQDVVEVDDDNDPHQKTCHNKATTTLVCLESGGTLVSATVACRTHPTIPPN